MADLAVNVADTPSRKPIDLLKAYKLRTIHHLSYRQIADKLDTPVASIHRALHDLCELIDDPERLDHYVDARTQLLTAVEERLIGSLVNDDKLAKASLNNTAYALKVVHEARRLEQGESTSNTSVLAKLICQAESELGTLHIDKQRLVVPPADPTD